MKLILIIIFFALIAIAATAIYFAVKSKNTSKKLNNTEYFDTPNTYTIEDMNRCNSVMEYWSISGDLNEWKSTDFKDVWRSCPPRWFKKENDKFKTSTDNSKWDVSDTALEAYNKIKIPLPPTLARRSDPAPIRPAYEFVPPPSYSDIFNKPTLLNKTISDIINKFSPVYVFHSDERYYPAPLGTFSLCNGIFDNNTSLSINNKQITDVKDLLLIGETSFDKRYKIDQNRLVTTKNPNYFISIIQDPSVTYTNYGSQTNTTRYILQGGTLVKYFNDGPNIPNGSNIQKTIGAGYKGFVLYNNILYTKKTNDTWEYHTSKAFLLYNNTPDIFLINTLNILKLETDVTKNSINNEITYTFNTSKPVPNGYAIVKYINGVEQRNYTKSGMYFVSYDDKIYVKNNSTFWDNTDNVSSVITGSELEDNLNKSLTERYSVTTTVSYRIDTTQKMTSEGYPVIKKSNNIIIPEAAVGIGFIFYKNKLYIKEQNGNWFYNDGAYQGNAEVTLWVRVTDSDLITDLNYLFWEEKGDEKTISISIKYQFGKNRDNAGNYNIIKNFSINGGGFGKDNINSGVMGTGIFLHGNTVYIKQSNIALFYTNNNFKDGWIRATDKTSAGIARDITLDRLNTITTYEPIAIPPGTPPNAGISQVKQDIITNYAYIAGDLYNPYFEQPGKTSYHLGSPGCTAMWSDNFNCQDLASKILEKNRSMAWGPNPQFCSIVTKKVFQNGFPVKWDGVSKTWIKVTTVADAEWVTDFVYTTYFAFNGSIAIIPGLGTHEMDIETIVARFLTSDLKNPLTAMPIRFYVSVHGGGNWYLPQDMMFRKLASNIAYGRNTTDKTHPIIYLGRESHEPYVRINENDTMRGAGIVSDVVGGGVCWQPPVLFLDNPQDSESYNVKMKQLNNICNSGDDFFGTFVSRPTTYTDVNSFFTDFIKLNIESEARVTNLLNNNFTQSEWTGKFDQRGGAGGQYPFISNNTLTFAGIQTDVSRTVQNLPGSSGYGLSIDVTTGTTGAYLQIIINFYNDNNTQVGSLIFGNINSTIIWEKSSRLGQVTPSTQDLSTATYCIITITGKRKEGIPTYDGPILANISLLPLSLPFTRPSINIDSYLNSKFFGFGLPWVYYLGKRSPVSGQSNHIFESAKIRVFEGLCVKNPNDNKHCSYLAAEPSFPALTQVSKITPMPLMDSEKWDSSKKWYVPQITHCDTTTNIKIHSCDSNKQVIRLQYVYAITEINTISTSLWNSSSQGEQGLLNKGWVVVPKADYQGYTKPCNVTYPGFNNTALYQDTNQDLGGGSSTDVFIIVRYELVDTQATTPVLVDLHVEHFGHKETSCPGNTIQAYPGSEMDDLLSGHGGTKGKCWYIGGCAYFSPINEVNEIIGPITLTRSRNKGAQIGSLVDYGPISDTALSSEVAQYYISTNVNNKSYKKIRVINSAGIDLTSGCGTSHDLYLVFGLLPIDYPDPTPTLLFNSADTRLIASSTNSFSSYGNGTDAVSKYSNCGGDAGESRFCGSNKQCSKIDGCVDPIKRTMSLSDPYFKTIFKNVNNSFDEIFGLLKDILRKNGGYYREYTKKIVLYRDLSDLTKGFVGNLSVFMDPTFSGTKPPIFFNIDASNNLNLTIGRTVATAPVKIQIPGKATFTTTKATLGIYELTITIPLSLLGIKLPSSYTNQEYVPGISIMLPPSLIKEYVYSPGGANNVYNNSYKNDTYKNRYSPWKGEINNRDKYVQKNLGYGTNPDSVLNVREFMNSAKLDISANKEAILQIIKTSLYNKINLNFDSNMTKFLVGVGATVAVVTFLTFGIGSLAIGAEVGVTLFGVIDLIMSKFNITKSKYQQPAVRLVNSFLDNPRNPNMNPAIDLLIIIMREQIEWDNFNMQEIIKLLLPFI
jgi:hypothetical protein